jgi:HlyD family secretion protein
MSHKKPPIPVILLVVVAIFVALYFGIRALTQKEEISLSLSGTIEGEVISVSAETPGRISEMLVAEGDAVKAGDILFRLEDTLLQSQREAAAASLALARGALASAKAQFDVIDAAVQLESAQAHTALWSVPDPSGYNLPDAYFSQSELLSAAETELLNAESALADAQNTLTLKLAEQESTDFKAAELALMRERAALLNAENTLAKARLSQNQDLIDAAQAHVDDTRENLDIAQSAYDELKDSDHALSIIADRVQVNLMSERVQLAREAWLKLQIGEDSPKWKAANAALEQAHAAVEQANAQLALIDTQIARLTVTAPAEGIIVLVAARPGEVVTAGARVISLTLPESLTVTVYVPEEQIGDIRLDQQAALSVDSFPSQVFYARVIQIADQAEFTPRNTSTTEGRKTTVFAVKLAIENPSNLLKAGMPADLTFLSQE